MSELDVPRDEASLLDAARHAQAEAASLQSPAFDIQETLRDLRTVLLSTDAGALRKSVGFFGRLLGRDIDLQAQSTAMREQLALLVLQARQRGEALDRHNHMLASLRDRLTALAGEFDGAIARHAETESHPTSDHARSRLLESTRLGCALTAAQLGVLVQNGQALSVRYQHMLPQVEGLLVQHRASLAGRVDATRMRDAASLVASIESGIAGLSPSPSATPMHAAAQESP
ncbi:hypothetical protein [Thermomonas carbonis]|uniref:Toxic anion resistance protein n=1 Tax=Thermomonas carbonis TaxID=1463158 RepID=A0A7G9SQZ8_9GAMM|nr:hypothetical protein [Thermomonas carbonis]QNN70273.1 hypothetical protein H9L16_01095 [Thermomonas carbonis]GHB98917.1 hypothetical protein GCM10010080_09400 [Thermomonas carbonis]